MIIEVQDLKKSFGGVDVLKGINCSVDEKQVVCCLLYTSDAATKA